MTSRDRLPPWHEHHRLVNGRSLLIRPIRPEDAEPLRAGFALLEPVETRSRLASMGNLDAKAAGRLSRPHPRTEFVLVATDLEDPGAAVIAALAHIQTDPAASRGEFTLLASRFVAGMGVRRYLLTRVAKWARSRRVGVLEGELPQSPEVLQLAESLGFHRIDGSDEPTLVRVALELPRA